MEALNTAACCKVCNMLSQHLTIGTHHQFIDY
ncbi:hypothetical protein BS78_10G175200 [Paspalum vaginatum]|nr:hypothetical protein BS78_10G175200 [Paspalum vaginatum]